MAQRAKQPVRGGKFVQFPPEADAEFEAVNEADIVSWREKLNERFGIGKGRLVVVEEVEARA